MNRIRGWGITSVVLGIVALVLAGCGGGGGGGGTAGASAPATYSISGTVSGNVSAGVTMTLTGTANATTTTAANGTYSFTGLANGAYTITPSAAGNTFAPGSITVNVNNANVTGQNFSSAAVPPAVPPITISGTVTGAWVDQVQLTISGGGGTVLTNASGNYSSASLAGGTAYTVTPSLPGYTFAPASVTTSASTATANFVATPVVPSYTISGTVTYAGAKTGLVYVNAQALGSVYPVGTAINLTAGSGTFTLRGVPAGTYTVTARMDSLGSGAFNAANPATAGGALAMVTTASVTGVGLTLVDPAPAAPATPVLNKVFPGDGSALIYFAPPAAFGTSVETDTTYKIYWGTDAAATTGTPVVLNAAGIVTGGYVLSGLTNGTNYYFKVSGLVGAVESAPSAVIGPVMIGAPTGLNTMSGTITFTGTAPALVVELVDTATSASVFQRIVNPVSPQAFSIGGLANGTYTQNAYLDLNNSGRPDAGDISNVSSNAPPAPQIVVAGNTTANLTLTAENASSLIKTSNFATLPALADNFQVSYGVWLNYKTPVAATLVSAPNVAVPKDLGTTMGSRFDSLANLGTVAPAAGDVYKVKVTYSDGTSEYKNLSISGVLNQARTLAPNALTAPGQTVPTFTWAAPLNPPASYTYSLSIVPAAVLTQVWSCSAMPGTQTSVLYNADGKATQPALAAGTNYIWSIVVKDQFGNSSSTQAQYMP